MNGVLQTCLADRSKKTKGKLLSKLLDSMICSVCHDYMFVPMMTQCGHNYCYSCLTSWFDSNSTLELSCPQCRASISETPNINSTLQQWLYTLLETLYRKEKGNEDFKALQRAKNESENDYKSDKKNDNLFNGIFKTSAIGVVDEDDDGILRCSNCHWELEDDDEGMCPHCNSRIRSRMATNGIAQQHTSEDEEEEEEEDEREIEDIAHSVQRYRAEVRDNIADLESESGSLIGDLETRFPFLIRSTAPGNAKVYFPTYSMYADNDMTLNENERSRRTRIIQSLEAAGRNLEDFSQLRHMNSSTAQEGYVGTDISEDDSPDEQDEGDVVIDSEDEESHNAIVDLEAEDTDNSAQEQDYDSDYLEHYEDDGFVTGDSLDDGEGEQDYLEHGADDDRDDNEHEMEEEEEDESQFRMPRRRYQVVLDGSEDE